VNNELEWTIKEADDMSSLYYIASDGRMTVSDELEKSVERVVLA
jgi:hypothetical protein